MYIFKKLLILLLSLLDCIPVFCGGDTLHYRFYFRVGASSLDLSYRDNGLRLDSLLSAIHSRTRRTASCKSILQCLS